MIYAGMAMPVTALRLPVALEEFLASQVRKAAIVAAVLHQKSRSEQLARSRSIDSIDWDCVDIQIFV